MPIILVFRVGVGWRWEGEGSGAPGHSQMHSKFVVSVTIRDYIRKEVERREGGEKGESREEKERGSQ